MVLWCLLLLGMVIFGAVEMVSLSIDHTAHLQLKLEARALAASGLAIALHPQIKKDDPLLEQTVSPNHRYKATIGSEGARLNLNYVLTTGHREILENLFTTWGVDLEAAQHAVDCLYDWVTPGDLRSLNGAKDLDYEKAGLPQRPSHKPFLSLDEVALVMGMDQVIKAQPNWRDSFTLWSSGPLDVSEAPPDLIAAVLSIAPSRAEFFTKTRNGRDEIVGTKDDQPVENMKAFQAALGLSDFSVKAVSNQISFKDSNRRVKSIGQAQGVQFMISAVTRLNATPIQYLLWSEQ